MAIVAAATTNHNAIRSAVVAITSIVTIVAVDVHSVIAAIAIISIDTGIVISTMWVGAGKSMNGDRSITTRIQMTITSCTTTSCTITIGSRTYICCLTIAVVSSSSSADALGFSAIAITVLTPKANPLHTTTSSDILTCNIIITTAIIAAIDTVITTAAITAIAAAITVTRGCVGVIETSSTLVSTCAVAGSIITYLVLVMPRRRARLMCHALVRIGRLVCSSAVYLS